MRVIAQFVLIIGGCAAVMVGASLAAGWPGSITVGGVLAVLLGYQIDKDRRCGN